MTERTEYLNKLIEWKDEQVIKVVTGIRRCGKSTLLELYADYLRSTGVADEQIIFINFEDLENEHLLDYKVLYKHICDRLCKDKYTYIFLDEIQKVENFEKAVDSLYIKKNTDIYMTGSNAYMLTGELATLLSGRYVEISMLPFSFKEYLEYHPSEDKASALAAYMSDGGFPYISVMEHSKSKTDMYIEGIYNTIIVKDIEDRQRKRESDPNKRKVADIVLLKSIARFLANSIGNPISFKSIADYITSTGRKVSQSTVSDYVEALCEAFIFYPALRFDIGGKELMKTNQKYYIVDLGLRRHLIAKRSYDLGFSLENLVYLELLRRGYNVNVGKVGNTEVDFVAKKDDRYYYFQVTDTMTSESTFNREIAPLQNIPDNYPKTILTNERLTLGNYNGIEVVNVIDWLLE